MSTLFRYLIYTFIHVVVAAVVVVVGAHHHHRNYLSIYPSSAHQSIFSMPHGDDTATIR